MFTTLRQSQIQNQNQVLRLPVVMLFAVLLLLPAGCGAGKDKDVPASVNGTAITEADLNKRVAFMELMFGHRAGGGQEMLKFRGQVLDMMIDEEIAYQEARRLKTLPDEAIIKEQLKLSINGMVEQRYGGSRKKFDQALKAAGLTREDLGLMLHRQLAEQKLYEKISAKERITPEDIRSFYDENQALMVLPEAVEVWQIVVKDEENGRKALAELKSGTDFAAVAKQYSTDANTRDQGGYRGFITRRDVMPDFAITVFALKPGETSGLFQSHIEYYIVKVGRHNQERKIPFEEARPALESRLLREKRDKVIEAYRERLLRQAKITRNS